MQRLNNCTFLPANVYRRCAYCTTGSKEFRCNDERLTDFPATYNTKDIEQDWYNVWQRNKYFASSKGSNEDRKPFNMILPPPNITGVLHLGHALTATVQDTLARWYRMKGHPVLWIPGFDHAGIATQAVMERYLRRTRNLSRLDLGKEEFTSLLWQWKTEKTDAIRNQLKIIGASLDWEREYFTIDEKYSTAVTEAFVRLHKRNLLYRDCNLVNWSPSLRSTISEIEVENLMINGNTKLHVPGYKKKVTFGRLMKLAYSIEDSNEELIVATTRPETMFGDVAIAVHPEDERYARYVGRRVLNPVRDGIPIPIVADSMVRKEFGTGVVKITPAHDRSDYDLAKKHNLPLISVINEDGNMTNECREFEGLPRFIVREKLLDKLATRGVLRGIEDDHKMTLPRCSRSQDIVEYLLKEQWYVRCKEMAKKAVDALENGSLRIEPGVHEQLWRDWLGNARDWCVSRQLWWGHRIPAYFVIHDNTSWIVARSEEEAYSIAREKHGNNVELRRDPDVLDTWFSSAIVPFATFGWPKHTQDMAKYYPLTLMETGHDILVFWVARMVMLGLELTQRLPFKEVLLHGILCDANGRKMSKSSGNVISPENIIKGCSLKELNAQAEQSHAVGILSAEELRRTLLVNTKSYPEGILDCGADALRMTLCGRNIKNRYVSFDVADCRTNKYFCNKIWQASKYVLLMANEDQQKKDENANILNSLDRWILSRLSETVKTVNIAFAERNFHDAVTTIRQFLHYEFCDLYMEGTKFGFKDGNANLISGHSYTLKKCLEVSLRLLAPIAPYLTDELYTKITRKFSVSFLPVSSLLEATYPESQEFEHLRDISLEENIRKVVNLIDAIRGCMANVSKKSNPEVNILTTNEEDYNLYKKNVNLIKGVSRIWNVPISLIKNHETISEEDICYIHTNDCLLLITATNASIVQQIRNNIAKKQNRTPVKEKFSKINTV